jgi:hypothetical protein
MPLGARILRSVIMVGLVVLLILIVHAGVLHLREPSLDMGQEPIDVEQLQFGPRARVDLYYSTTRNEC